MRSGLFFKLMNSNPSIVLSQKSLFKYTFLESSYLNTKLKEDATCHSNKSILDFLERPFSLK
jgi:hypothetical protein